MALRLGQGGRIRSLDAMAGKSVSAQSVYASLYFTTNSEGVFFPANISSTLSDFADWEILPPGTGGYNRVNVTPLLGVAAHDPRFLYGEIVNTSNIDFAPTAPLNLPIEEDRQIGFIVLSTQSVAQSEDVNDIIAFGPLLDPIIAYSNGDIIRIEVGSFSIRQS